MVVSRQERSQKRERLHGGDNFHFNKGVFWQARDLDGRTRRGSSGKIVGVDFVHYSEVAHILQKHRVLNHVAKFASRRLYNSLHVLERAFCLCANISWDKFVRFRIYGNLSGNEKKSVDLDGLGIRADRFWTAIRQNNFSHGMVSLGLMAVETEESS